MNRDLLHAKRNEPSFQILDADESTSAEYVLRLVGNLDADGSPLLSEALERPLSRNTIDIALDFAEVDFISSSGIGALVAAIGEYRDEGGDIRLVNVSNSLQRVFEALDLLDYVHLESSGS